MNIPRIKILDEDLEEFEPTEEQSLVWVGDKLCKITTFSPVKPNTYRPVVNGKKYSVSVEPEQDKNPNIQQRGDMKKSMREVLLKEPDLSLPDASRRLNIDHQSSKNIRIAYWQAKTQILEELIGKTFAEAVGYCDSLGNNKESKNSFEAEEPRYISANFSDLQSKNIDALLALSLFAASNNEGRIILDTRIASLREINMKKLQEAIHQLLKEDYIIEESDGAYIVNPSKIYFGSKFNREQNILNWERAKEQKDVAPGTGDEEYCVYIHYFPNGKYYVGISKDIGQRWEGDGKHYDSNPDMYQAIQEFGWNNIRHRVVCSRLSREEALSIENTLIRPYGVDKLYNRTC